MTWSEMEFQNLDLGDKHTNARTIKIAKSPKSSIPEAWAETLAT